MKKTYSLTINALVFLLVLAATGRLGAESVTVVLDKARSYLGASYKPGGLGAEGFDCSGFVWHLYRPNLPGLPRMSRDMARTGVPVAPGDWQPGDLLFYATGQDPAAVNHVAIWVGDNQIIHSISDGPETGVVITPADARYWHMRYISSRRVLPFPTDEDVINNGVEPALQDDEDSKDHEPTAEDGEEDHEGAVQSGEDGMEEDKASLEESPWEDFEGLLQGDFEAWLEAETENFENYQQNDD